MYPNYLKHSQDKFLNPSNIGSFMRKDHEEFASVNVRSSNENALNGMTLKNRETVELSILCCIFYNGSSGKKLFVLQHFRAKAQTPF